MSPSAVHSYSFDRAFKSALRPEVDQDAPKSGLAFIGPSPFEVPERLWVSTDEMGRVVVLFGYASSEPLESDFRALRADQSLAVRVAATTKLIRAVRFGDGVLEGLSPEHSWLDTLVRDLSQEVKTRQSKAAVAANVRVIQQIFRTLTKELLNEAEEARRRTDSFNAQQAIADTSV